MRRGLDVVASAVAIALLSACGGGHKQTAVAGPKQEAPGRTDLAPPAIKALLEGAAFAKIYLREGDATGAKTRAINKLREAIGLDSRLWEARYDLGLVFARAGVLNDAERSLAEAASIAPESEPVAVALCEVRRRRGEQRLASEGLEAFVKAHPDALDARARLVVVLREAGKNDDAITSARFVLARRPLDDGTRAELALSHLAKGETDVAELLVAQALKQNPKSVDALRAEGLISLQRGDDASAFRAFERAADLDPTDTTARVNMGNVLVRAGAFKEAETAFRAVLATAADDEGALLGLGIALRGEKKFDDARATYERLLQRSPNHLPANFALAVLYADFLKDAGKARVLFKKVVDDAPSGSTFAIESARYLKEIGDGAPIVPAAAPPPTTPPAAAPPPAASAHPAGTP